jgi:hypothetical protein
MKISRVVHHSVLLWSVSLCLTPAGSGVAGANDGGASSAAPGPTSRDKHKHPKTTDSFASLKSIGTQIALAMTEKRFEQIYPLLCTADRSRTTAAAFGAMQRELHAAAETTTVDVGNDDEIVRENRRAGAHTVADLAGMSTVMVPFRLHAPGHAGGDLTSIQVWAFRREGASWCTPLD